jgi:hypothetical protein
MATAPANQVRDSGFPKVVKYKTLKTRNDAYMGEFWQKCKALYAGGPALLNNQTLLKTCMPKHSNEADDVYKERLSRAFYIPYPGSIIDKLVAELMSKPLTFEPEDPTSGSEDGGEAGVKDSDEEPLPQYYADLVKNCAKPGGKRMSMNEFAREQIFNALTCQTAWALVDLPKAPVTGYVNRAEQDKAGGLNAYICPIDPECVIDWEEKDDGELAWVLIQDTIAKRKGIGDQRNTVTLRWRYFREEDWAIYELTYDKTKKAQGPSDNEDVTLVDEGKHSFQRVPVRRMMLPEGLWAMGKLEAIARAHLNQRNALSWGQLKALFPVPVLYAQAPDTTNPVSEDMGRASQTHGQGYLRVFAEKDRLEYFSPDVAPYTVAQADLSNLRDEMHRVLYAMAQSVDNSGAALQRSGESKAIDQAAAAVILRALGTYLREHLEDILLTISTGRKDNLRFSAHGMDNFDDITLSQLVLDAIGIGTVEIPSATFQQLFKYKVAKLALGADVTEDDLDTIKEELASTNTQDLFDAQTQADQAGHEARQAQAEAATNDPTGEKALAKTEGKKAPKIKGPKIKPQPSLKAKGKGKK